MGIHRADPAHPEEKQAGTEHDSCQRNSHAMQHMWHQCSEAGTAVKKNGSGQSSLILSVDGGPLFSAVMILVG